MQAVGREVFLLNVDIVLSEPNCLHLIRNQLDPAWFESGGSGVRVQHIGPHIDRVGMGTRAGGECTTCPHHISTQVIETIPMPILTPPHKGWIPMGTHTHESNWHLYFKVILNRGLSHQIKMSKTNKSESLLVELQETMTFQGLF